MSLQFLTCAGFLVLGCQSISGERDRISFRDDFQAVHDSLQIAVQALHQLSGKSPHNSSYLWGLDGKFLFGNRDLGIANNLLDDSFDTITRSTKEQRERFLNLITFLRLNFMPGAFYNAGTLTYAFHYRLTIVGDQSEDRYIILCTDEAIRTNVYDDWKVLEMRQDVALVAPRLEDIR